MLSKKTRFYNAVQEPGLYQKVSNINEDIDDIDVLLDTFDGQVL